MSISERERQALGSIEEDLAGSVPELAAKLAVFTRLTAGEAMPPRERVWRPARTPSASPASPATVSGGQEAARSWRWLRRRTVWRLVALALAIGFLALAFGANHGVGKGTDHGASKSSISMAQAPDGSLPSGACASSGTAGVGAPGVKDG